VAKQNELKAQHFLAKADLLQTRLDRREGSSVKLDTHPCIDLVSKIHNLQDEINKGNFTVIAKRYGLPSNQAAMERRL
jgi:hypothetical protein